MSDFANADSREAPLGAHVPGGPTLGLLLRKAREARGLSVDDVVHALKLSARQIEAIETDRMDLLPGVVFQRGFVRSYARLLKLDPAPLLGLISPGVVTHEPEIRPPENMGNAGPRGGLRNIPVLVLLSIALLLTAAGVTVWHYLGGNLPQLSAFSGPRATAPSPTVETADLAPPVDTKPDTGPAVRPIQAKGAESTAPVPVSAPAPVSATNTLQAANGRVLTFDFRGESWIEVKDAAGATVLSGVFSSGSQVATGRAPFEVVLGNAPAVSLRDNDKVIDLKPHTRADVARLTLE